MKTLKFVAAIILLATFTSLAQTADCDKIMGVWFSEKKDGKVEIYKTGDKYFGKLIWGNDLYAADGKTSKKDVNNADPQLRNRNLKDLVLLSNFTYNNGEWAGGKIYDPTSGKTYSCSMKLKNSKLDIRGFVGISLFGRSTTWTRVQ